MSVDLQALVLATYEADLAAYERNDPKHPDYLDRITDNESD